MDRSDAHASLEAIRQTEDRLAGRMRWPLWRHAALGVFLALLLLGIALPFSWQIPITLLALGLIFLVIRSDKKRHGMFVSGYQRGRTGWVVAAIVALFIAMLLLANTLVTDPLDSALFWAIETVLLAGSTALSLVWEKVYRADLKAGRA